MAAHKGRTVHMEPQRLPGAEQVGGKGGDKGPCVLKAKHSEMTGHSDTSQHVVPRTTQPSQASQPQSPDEKPRSVI